MVLCMICLLAAVPALAADVFMYEDRTMTLFEGDEGYPVILRDGKFDTDGTISYTVNNKKICSVDSDGTIHALARGTAIVTASLNRNGKLLKKTSIQITVSRRVTKVTLSTKNLQVYEPDDEYILELLGLTQEAADPAETVNPDGLEPDETQEPDGTEDPFILTNRVIVLPAGKSALLNAVCTPEDATNRKILFETDDVGVAKIVNGKELKGVECGECDLTISSVQNPEVTETFHVLVIEPVKKITVDAPFKSVSAGGSMQLDAVFTPDTATIQKVTWTSRNPKIATVDEDGVVTGLTKGRVTIDAKAADGSNVVGSVVLNVTQDVTDIVVGQYDVTVATGRSVQLKVNVLPQSANDRSVTWTSSDESIATVRNGQITGRRAGECYVTCTSNSNPDISADVAVSVIQMVTKITFQTAPGLSFPVHTSQQLDWEVYPEDATIKDVTFRSLSPKIATVDQNGMVTAVSRGQAKIVATAKDGSGRQGTYVVNVTQPVEGIELSADTYYVQLDGTLDIRPTILPKNASNQRVHWSSSDTYTASVRTAGTNTGRVTGQREGSATLTATTEDGGYTATTEVLVDDFNGAVKVESSWIDKNNKIKLSMWNTSNQTVRAVYFTVKCYDTQGYEMVCNKDGESTFFEGSYPMELQPGDRTMHGRFNFNGYEEPGTLGYVIVTVTGFEFDNGQKWMIPEDDRVPCQSIFSDHYGEPASRPETDEPEDDDDDNNVLKEDGIG